MEARHSIMSDGMEGMNNKVLEDILLYFVRNAS
jgi:hypothetical protein